MSQDSSSFRIWRSLSAESPPDSLTPVTVIKFEIGVRNSKRRFCESLSSWSCSASSPDCAFSLESSHIDVAKSAHLTSFVRPVGLATSEGSTTTDRGSRHCSVSSSVVIVGCVNSTTSFTRQSSGGRGGWRSRSRKSRSMTGLVVTSMAIPRPATLLISMDGAPAAVGERGGGTRRCGIGGGSGGGERDGVRVGERRFP